MRYSYILLLFFMAFPFCSYGRGNVNDTLWTDARNLLIEGRGWSEGIGEFARLPDRFESVVTPAVWNLSRHSSGITVRFYVSGTDFLSVRYELIQNRYMPHMTPQAVNGVDLYIRHNGKWVWAAVGKPDKSSSCQQYVLKDKGLFPDQTYECMLYLPLYSGIMSLDLGCRSGSHVEKPDINPYRPIVFYGTSILHGCSASRAGMTFTSMLGRHFDIPAVNLGFSGNGKMENYFGDILGEIDASAYVIDCLPNMAGFSEQEITGRVLDIVRKLKLHAPDTPVVLVEDRTHAHPNFSEKPVDNPRRRAQKSAYDILKKEYRDIYYVKGDLLLGDDTEATVDGSHPSDLGMYRYFVQLKPVLEKALGQKKNNFRRN